MTDIQLNVNPKWQRIGISLSGGADSALLAYLILKQTNAEIFFTTQIRMWKSRPWQGHIARQVVRWFKFNFPHTIHHIEGFIPPEMEEPHTTNIEDEYGKIKPGNRIILRAHNEYIAHEHKLDAWFAGVNKNPDIEISGALSERDEGVLPVHMQHMGVDICHPFVYTSKDWIIKQYYDLGITELLDLTRSCEGEFKGLDYTTWTPGKNVPTCGECFWCKEREWAISKCQD